MRLNKLRILCAAMSVLLVLSAVGCTVGRFVGLSEEEISKQVRLDIAVGVDAVEYLDTLQKQGWKLEKDIEYNRSMSLLPGRVELSCGDITLGVNLDIDHAASIDGAEADGVEHIDSYRSKYWVIKGIESIKITSSRKVAIDADSKKVPENFTLQRAIEDAVTKGDTIAQLEAVITPMGFIREDDGRVCTYRMDNYTLTVNPMQQSVTGETAIESIDIEYSELTSFAK